MVFNNFVILMNSEFWLTQLHNNGYRLTGARRAVVETMAASPRVLTPAEVFDAARDAYPALGLVTVYRTLDKLEELGLIQRVHQPQGCKAFIASGNGHQHLLLCQSCGKAVLFSGDELEQLINHIAAQTGYKIKDHWLQLLGVCSNCL